MFQQDFDLSNLDFDAIARLAWEGQKTPLEKMYDRWVGQAWEPNPTAVTFRIYDQATDQPIPCHLCQSTDSWVAEGDEVRQLVRVFVCEHEPIWAGWGMLRQISTVPVRKVGRLEETGRPVE